MVFPGWLVRELPFGTVGILRAGVESKPVLDARCSNGPSMIATWVRIAAKQLD